MYEIQDDKDFENTKRLKKEFTENVAALKEAPLNGVDPILRKAEIESCQSMIGDFDIQMKTYEEKKKN